MFKRLFDILLSLNGIIVSSPVLLIIGISIKIDSKGSILFIQRRVGKDGKDFNLYKFRTMTVGASNKGLLTVGKNDNRITKLGYSLRKYKLDELPQLFNVIKGDMSIVGPRPEVRKYVELYNDEQKKVLSVRPGITDYASIEYINENEILGKSSNPEETYIKEVMPAKLLLNLKYINNNSLYNYFKIIFKTLLKIISR